MKKYLKMLTLSIVVTAFCAGSVLAAPTAAKTTDTAPVVSSSSAGSIAIVDVQKVVATSAQVAALKKEQEAKAKDLLAFVEKARKDVAAQTDTKKKQTLEEKYNKELNSKKEAMDKNYADKLAKIDSSISKQIESIAKANGYSMVVVKGIVLFGGVDITDKVINSLK